MRMNPVYDIPPVSGDQIEKPKVEAQIIQDKGSVVISLVFPYEAIGELDAKKGVLLRDTFIEIKRLANDLNTTLGLENKGLLEKIFGSRS